MKLSYATSLISAALLAGCSASGPSYNTSELLPRDGVRTFRVDCQGLLSTSQTCMKAARRICSDQPVRIIDSVRALRDDSDPVTLVFQCGAAVASAPAAEPAPAPVPVDHVSFAGDALFATRIATLAPGASASMDRMLSNGEDRTYSQVTITGYTDSVGSDAANLDLSKRRAETVAGYLMLHGLKAKTLKVTGRGAADPVAPNSTIEGRARNRRVEMVLIR
ncbi:hypothetical protein WS97_27945 [Burkholderia territorii]|uniref:OmpA family protein n=1 Tax=Burkholderia territorii TaxID=1503055 RepID=UPI00075E6DBA|nr:OmpA family protein [Burkholderia territorii]KVL27932.1 hypothetical protein WS97_27945 [Burkholderia territorii]KWO68057.1 hypothetical protein WT98_23015 [Burkholderia territorii]